MYYLIKGRRPEVILIVRSNFIEYPFANVVEVIQNYECFYKVGQHNFGIWDEEILDKDKSLKKIKERIGISLL